MKKDELLYRAIGDIKDKTAADAYESGGEGKRGGALWSVLSVAAAVAAVVGLFAFYAVLMRYSSKSNVTPSPGASGNETADIVTGVEEDTSEYPVVTELVWETPSVEEIYNMYPYSEFLPADIPDGFEAIQAYRFAPCLFINPAYPNNTEPEMKNEKGSVTFIANAENLSDADKEDQLVTRKYDCMYISVFKPDDSEDISSIKPLSMISVDQIENNAKIYEDYYGDLSVKLCLSYDLSFIADGWIVKVGYIKHGPRYEGEKNKELFTVGPEDYASLLDSPQLSAQDIFDMITSSPYFKTHPVSDPDGKNTVKPVYKYENDGIELTIEFGSDTYCWDSLINVTATLKNNKNKQIQVYRPVQPYGVDSHTEISIEIYRPDNTSVRLKDIDVYGVPFNDAESWITLEPGEEYTQIMRFTGDTQSFGEHGGVEMEGDYNVEATVGYTEGTDNIRTLTYSTQIHLGQ